MRVLSTCLIAWVIWVITGQSVSAQIVPIQSIGCIKANCADDEIVGACGVVIAMFNNAADPSKSCVYMESKDRSSGIRFCGLMLNLGIEYGFAGKIETDPITGERQLTYEPAPMCGIATEMPKPLYMPNCRVGGGDFAFNASAHRGQPGVHGGSGLNNVGLLIKTSGKVMATNSSLSYFYIDDGSRCNDGSGYLGIRVSYRYFPAGPLGLLPKRGDWVSVTGVSCMMKIASKLRPIIECRGSEDFEFISFAQ